MWTVAQLAADLAAGRTTSRALTEQALARIADPGGEGARAFMQVNADSALAEADFSDQLRKRGGARWWTACRCRSRTCSTWPAR